MTVDAFHQRPPGESDQSRTLWLPTVPRRPAGPTAPGFGQPPYANHPQGAPPPSDRRRRALISACLILVLALVAGVAGGWGSSNRSAPRPAEGITDPNIGHELPFGSAVLALAGAPEVHYQGTVDGDGQADVHVTSHGELTGTLSQDGQTYSVLGVDGKLFLKPPDSGLPGVDPAEAAAWKGKWLTGQPAQDVFGPVTSSFVPPAKLAGQLLSALNAAPSPQVVDAQLDGMAVLEAKTPIGLIAVTKAEPNRFVRIVPDSGADGSAQSPSPPASTPNALGPASSGTVEDAAFHHAESSGTVGVRVLPEQPGEVANTYQNLQNQTQQLSTGSVNTDLQLSKQGDSVNCSAAGCQVNVNVGDAVSTSSGSVQGGTITAVLTATVAIEGRPAGGCTASSPLPLSGTTAMSCSDPEAAGAFAAADAAKKQQAQAESRAEGGRAVNYSVNFSDQYTVFATALVNVAQLVRNQGQEAADDAKQKDPCDTSDTGRASGARPASVLIGHSGQQGLRLAAADADQPCSPYVWNPGRPGVDNGPQGPLPPNAPFVKPGDKLKPGDYHYVVLPGGTVRAMNNDDMWKANRTAGHTSLAGGKPVIMAGTFKVDSTGQISELDNFSGHYQPLPKTGYMDLEDLARDSFAANGLPAPLPDAWDLWTPKGWTGP
ncbi:hypothetical protein KGQ19_10780 [Catenulispora sp. NL8]|uniref:Uncharacterized protein n=1 Tax=Catenulispora pinistramenti TaxID=2705254 RepID=A0ABS5KMX1_9ACTN|nr:hypothetical protein [Catenulispora pinistramenti]MBS2547359.1 hypothetical protein [Catenulispora pinistramenti]